MQGIHVIFSLIFRMKLTLSLKFLFLNFFKHFKFKNIQMLSVKRGKLHNLLTC